MVVSEVKPEATPKKKTKKTKKEEITPPPKEEITPPKEEAKKEPPKEAKKEVKKEAKETKPTTKEAKPETKPPKAKRPRIKTTTWEKFEKFTTKTETKRKSWIKEVIEKATKEPIEIRGLTRGQLVALIVQINNHNRRYEPKLDIKYDFKKGIALIAPIKKTTF
jgi:hypothetical protein